MPALYIETYGCQMNEADSRYIAERAISAGYTVVDDASAANVLVLNTCTVRDSAEKRAYGRMGVYKQLKANDPTRKIVVCGCLAEQDREIMSKRVPFVDGIYGTKELRTMSDAIAAWVDDFEQDDILHPEAMSLPLGLQSGTVADAFTPLRAYVNVQRGCSYYCSYCIVPKVRGRFDHRDLAEIDTEVRARVASGAREITLVGQTVNAYVDPGSGLSFAGLLRYVAALPGVERVGFITSHPKDINDETIAAFAQVAALQPRLHLALQSGSDPILRRMNRKYTIAEYLACVERFRSACPNWALTTDIIVGFPGETEEDFARTLEVVDRGLFAQVYAFIFSPRRGTPAAAMEPLPADVVAERFRRLMATVNRHVTAYHERKVGETVRALVVGPSRKDSQMISAKTGDNVTVLAPFEGAAERFAATPWLDMRIESGRVWGCSATLVGVAAEVHGASETVTPPLLNLFETGLLP